MSRSGKPSNAPPAKEAATDLRIRVQTRSSRPGVGPLVGEEWTVRVKAAPAENAANRAVLALLAETLGIAPSRVEIVAGHTSTHKRLRISGLTTAQVDARLRQEF